METLSMEISCGVDEPAITLSADAVRQHVLLSGTRAWRLGRVTDMVRSVADSGANIVVIGYPELSERIRKIVGRAKADMPYHRLTIDLDSPFKTGHASDMTAVIQSLLPKIDENLTKREQAFLAIVAEVYDLAHSLRDDVKFDNFRAFERLYSLNSLIDMVKWVRRAADEDDAKAGIADRLEMLLCSIPGMKRDNLYGDATCGTVTKDQFGYMRMQAEPAFQKLAALRHLTAQRGGVEDPQTIWTEPGIYVSDANPVPGLPEWDTWARMVTALVRSAQFRTLRSDVEPLPVVLFFDVAIAQYVDRQFLDLAHSLGAGIVLGTDGLSTQDFLPRCGVRVTAHGLSLGNPSAEISDGVRRDRFL